MRRLIFCAFVLSASVAHGAITFSVAFDDPLNQLTAVATQVEQHVLAAGNLWANYLEGNGSIEVVVRASSSIPFAEGRSLTSGFVVNNGSFDVFEQGMTAELRTGVDPNGTTRDVEILLNPDYAVNELWYDPDPIARTTTVDINRTDAMSTFIHEFGHAIGFQGWINPTTGTFPGNYQSTFDENIQFDGTNFYFTGPAATSINNSPPPLTFGNVNHVANFAPRPGENLVLDVMNGLVFYRGHRYEISTLDLAMLQDMGVPLADRGGDFDFDGDVDGHDFLTWQRGASPEALSGGDLAAWQAGYGFGGLSDAASFEVVPEPASLLLALMFGMTVLRRKSCRKVNRT